MSSPWQPEGAGARTPRRVDIAGPVGTVVELAEALSAAVFGPRRPAPRNLDGLADLLREARVGEVAVRGWRLSPAAGERVEEVFRDNGVRLRRRGG